MYRKIIEEYEEYRVCTSLIFLHHTKSVLAAGETSLKASESVVLAAESVVTVAQDTAPHFPSDSKRTYEILDLFNRYDVSSSITKKLINDIASESFLADSKGIPNHTKVTVQNAYDMITSIEEISNAAERIGLFSQNLLGSTKNNNMLQSGETENRPNIRVNTTYSPTVFSLFPMSGLQWRYLQSWLKSTLRRI
ncbi:hypothetical protein BD770DRAFT_445219 [Pilaira anomala]|nr:hypothetical protein BD770DRAFT_445219 [Pilaira anomala]